MLLRDLASRGAGGLALATSLRCAGRRMARGGSSGRRKNKARRETAPKKNGMITSSSKATSPAATAAAKRKSMLRAKLKNRPPGSLQRDFSAALPRHMAEEHPRQLMISRNVRKTLGRTVAQYSGPVFSKYAISFVEVRASKSLEHLTVYWNATHTGVEGDRPSVTDLPSARPKGGSMMRKQSILQKARARAKARLSGEGEQPLPPGTVTFLSKEIHSSTESVSDPPSSSTSGDSPVPETTTDTADDSDAVGVPVEFQFELEEISLALEKSSRHLRNAVVQGGVYKRAPHLIFRHDPTSRSKGYLHDIQDTVRSHTDVMDTGLAASLKAEESLGVSLEEMMASESAGKGLSEEEKATMRAFLDDPEFWTARDHESLVVDEDYLIPEEVDPDFPMKRTRAPKD